MRRIVLIPLLALGTVFGFAHGFHALHQRGPCGHGAWAEPGEQLQAPATPSVNPVQVQAAPAAPAQTLVIPIIVGVPGAATPPQPYVIQVPPPSAPAPNPPAAR